ncbi:hypothetical protein CFP56_034553 [Quercus suber]|uniref:Zinc knuckle CX2CX4HX4C domain-containing protein n=1 Tax=Quercus suber TaxID=58331 RepID=A0AAW0JC39_QUESU
MVEELEELWKKLSFTEEEIDDVELRSGSTKVAIVRGKKYYTEGPHTNRADSKGDRTEVVSILDSNVQPVIEKQNKGDWVAIGFKLGEVLDVDVPESRVHWGKCLRVRIRIDATKRLVRGKRVTIEEGKNRYEWLPNFCYSCGMLSHGIKECLEGPANALQNAGKLQYGAWMRGEPMRRGNKENHSPNMDGGLEGGGITETRSEAENSSYTELRGASVVGSLHAPRLADRGDDSPT